MAEPAAKKVTQEEVKSAEENVKKLRKEGASKELVSHTLLHTLTNQNTPLVSRDACHVERE